MRRRGAMFGTCAMVKVVYVSSTGERREAEAESGMTVMETAVKIGIDEILGECGGACACATCHVYVAQEWFDKLPPASPMETDMLDFAVDPRPNSRLSCQISLTEELDGIVVETPDRQG
jgi:ferredoxin, 2Fe-2S